MSESQKPNSWSKTAPPQGRPDSRAEAARDARVDWRLARASGADGDLLFASAVNNPMVRVLTALAKRRLLALTCGLLLIAGAAYCLAAPAGSTLAGLPADICSIALAAAAILLALLVTLGAWLRPLESVEEAMEVLGVPLVAFEKGGTPDVR